MLDSLMAAEPVQAALKSAGCLRLFASTPTALRQCRVATRNGTMLHVALAGPFDAGAGDISFRYADAFGLSELLAERDVLAQAVFVAPIDASQRVLPNPPIDVHHVDLVEWVPLTLVWGISEESACEPPLGVQCYGRRFGEYAFRLKRGGEAPAALATIRPRSSLPLTFWLAMVLEEPMEASVRSSKVPVSSLYVQAPLTMSLALSNPMAWLMDFTVVPRDQETVFWFAWQMPGAGELVDMWFHSHSTTQASWAL